MEKYYTNERNVQIVIALLKANNIKKIIVSPGATNITFVGSIQNDPFFDIYSCVDERSAAYMACGMAAETGEPVVINCTGATSSRNWLPGLTEAFYRKLPILAISSSQTTNRVGHLVAQVTNRATPPEDSVVKSLNVRLVKDNDDEFDAICKVNTAISLLSKNGGGPVHINLETSYSKDYSVKSIPFVRMIKRYTHLDDLPELGGGRIAIAIGNHLKFSNELTCAVDEFCLAHNSVVFCDHTSGYHGKYRVSMGLVFAQKNYNCSLNQVDVLIHIGEVSGDYSNLYKIAPKAVWRVSQDGEIRDLYKKLTCIFDMTELEFFNYYKNGSDNTDSYLNECNTTYELFYSQIPDLPFSNLWIAKNISAKLPSNSKLHLGILNSLRSWNYFKINPSIESSSNTGGFGIDGVLSTVIGASICRPDTLFYCILGDLSFFYDLNSIGNRHVGNNVRILIVNNGRGQEFRNHSHDGNLFGKDADKYIAAAGHNGNMSSNLVRHIAQDLGYQYITASDKESFNKVSEVFLCPDITDSPIIFEVFTQTEDESEALDLINSFYTDTKSIIINETKKTIKKIVGQSVIDTVKSIIK